MRVLSDNPSASNVDPILSILVPILNTRNTWRTLLKKLRTQITKLDLPKGTVEVLTAADSGEATSGVKRQRLVNLSRGKYIAFIDDDDDIADCYVEKILKGCAHEPDVVTFNLEMTFAGSPRREVWTYHLGPDNRRAGLMTANHLCAWKKDLATLVGWCPFLGYGDDQLWYQPLHATGKVRKEYSIPETLYHYRFDFSNTVNQRPDIRQFAVNYVGTGLECYWLDNQVAIQLGHLGADPPKLDSRLSQEPFCHVVTWLGHVIEIPKRRLTKFSEVSLS